MGGDIVQNAFSTCGGAFEADFMAYLIPSANSIQTSDSMLLDLFSKRQKRARGECPDVYQYENIPGTLRVQVVHIINSIIKSNLDIYGVGTLADHMFSLIYDTLCREYGVFKLNSQSRTHQDQVLNYLLQVDDIERALDVIELCFRVIDGEVRQKPHEFNSSESPDEGIKELNARFREHGVGFQFEQGSIIRIDSELLHSEVVRPLLAAMNNSLFRPALSEFHSAHEHYRHKRYKESLTECAKSFESAMKIICAKKGWQIDPKATSSKLIQALFDNSFLPSYLQTQLTAIRTLLESGTPTIRNNNSAHGQGTASIVVAEELASYCLHLTATNLLFLVKNT